MKQAGVYTILNLVTGRCYVGSSFNVPKRWQQHLTALNRGAHVNLALQSDWIRYGAQSFSWTLTQACATRADAILAEQVHIDSAPDRYNASARAGSGRPDGFKHPPEAIQRMVAAQSTNIGKRVKRSLESRLRMSAFQKGRPKSAEHRAKIGAANKGQKKPLLSLALKGRTLPPDVIAKLRSAKLGGTLSVAHKQNISRGLLGRVQSLETRAKISTALSARPSRPWSINRWHAYALEFHVK